MLVKLELGRSGRRWGAEGETSLSEIGDFGAAGISIVKSGEGQESSSLDSTNKTSFKMTRNFNSKSHNL